MGYIWRNKCIRFLIYNRFKAIYILCFIRIISPFYNIFLSPVRVIGHRRTLDKDKMQIRCRSNLGQIIGVNNISV